MITNELEIGSTYKSLKDMCDILDYEYSKSANSRKATLKKIESEYKLERKGNSYTVLERYEIKLEILDKRKETKGNNSSRGKYDTLMDNLIIDWLYRFDEIEIHISFNEIFTQDKENKNDNIPIYSIDYKDLLNNGYEEFAKELSIRKDLVNMYREKMYLITSKCFETSLERLHKQNILNCKKNIMVKYYAEENEIADKHLIAEIKQAEKEVYEKMDITSFQRVNPNINKKFKRGVCKKLARYKISSYWNVYSIKILDEDKLMEIENIDEIRIELVNRFVNSIRDSLYNKKYDNIYDDVALGKKRENERYNPFKDYTKEMTELSNILFIDYDKSDIDVEDEEWDKQIEREEKEKKKKEAEERKQAKLAKKKNK